MTNREDAESLDANKLGKAALQGVGVGVGVLISAGIAWFFLILLVESDKAQALKTGEAFLGFATTLAGVLGIAVGTRMSFRTEVEARTVALQSGTVGLMGVLAGGTLMGAGEWATPLALGALVLGTSAVKFANAWKGN